MNWYKQAQVNNIPSILYHSTFKSDLESIKQKGLDPYSDGITKCWTGCENGVYLHSDADASASYPEVADNPDIPDEWFDDIIALEIDTTSLNKNLFVQDPNLPEGENIDSFLYRGTIPYGNIRNIL